MSYRMATDPMGPVVVTVDRTTMGAGDQTYAVPTYGTDGPGYQDAPAGAYATRLGVDATIGTPGATPDPMREQQMPTRDMRPEPAYNPAYFWTGPRGPGTERMLRHQVEFLDADGIETNQPNAGAAAPDPRWIPPPEPRITNRLSPHTFLFTRPFAQETDRYFTGEHFSMADHRRQYPILGMAPSPYHRNTYRADPVPWDTFRTDMPNPSPSETPGRIIAYDIPPTPSNQSWRLGG
jgi:hypothetical protein